MLNASIERLVLVHRQHGIEMLPNYQRRPFDFVDPELRMVSLFNTDEKHEKHELAQCQIKATKNIIHG